MKSGMLEKVRQQMLVLRSCNVSVSCFTFYLQHMTCFVLFSGIKKMDASLREIKQKCFIVRGRLSHKMLIVHDMMS